MPDGVYGIDSCQVRFIIDQTFTKEYSTTKNLFERK